MSMGAGDLFSVEGRAAVVTGASSGLGERFAEVLAANGARVLAVARRADRLAELAERTPGIVPFAADLAQEAERARVIEAAVETLGGIDILINNAGYGDAVRALDEPVSTFRDVLELNLVALFELSRLAAGHMLTAGRGSIVNVGSIFGLVASSPIPNASYTASKGAVTNLSRELGCQWARKGVRVNVLAPGFFPTESTDGLAEGPAGEMIRRECPMRRMGEPHELDGALLFLASDASSYCTGQVLTIDGGWTAR